MYVSLSSGDGSYFEQIEVVLALIEPMIKDGEL